MQRDRAQIESQVWLNAGPWARPLPFAVLSLRRAKEKHHPESPLLLRGRVPQGCRWDLRLGCNLGRPSPHWASVSSLTH